MADSGPGRMTGRAKGTERATTRGLSDFDVEGLQEVSLLEVHKPLQPHAALEASGNLTNVVLEPPQAVHHTGMDQGAIPDQTDLGAPGDHPIADLAPSDAAPTRADAGNPSRLSWAQQRG